MSSLHASNFAIKAEDLSLDYKTFISRPPNMKEKLLNIGRGHKSAITVQALKHVSFEIPHGTVLGVIGSNGAGKSTLMKALAGLLPPTSGMITIDGKVNALLSLGIGFNANFSGRNNVVLGGLASGLTRNQVDENFDAIVDFAELWDHIDLPMRTYSAGMYSRLAFSVATTISPEILVIDEALSAGDAHFKEKSADRIAALAKQAKTLVIVSHSLGTIQELCNQAIWLNHGELVMQADPSATIDAYKHFLNVGEVPMVMEDM